MAILSLDISTSTGFVLLTPQGQILERGSVEMSKEKVKDFGGFPRNYVLAARDMARKIVELIKRVKPNVVVVEETNIGGRANQYSQKLLEFIHCLFLLEYLEESVRIVYITTAAWRKSLGLVLTKEDRRSNNKARAANHAGTTAAEKRAARAAAGVAGKVTVKHLSVRFVNQRFGLGLLQKDNDQADAICLGLAYIAGAPHCDGPRVSNRKK